MTGIPKAFILILVPIIFSSCESKTVIMAGYQDGEELAEGDLVPFLLEQNFPNPFNPSTEIHYQVVEPMHLILTVYTDDWQEVVVLEDRNYGAGYHRTIFNGRNFNNEPVASGDYFYTLAGSGVIMIRKMKVLK